MLIAPLVSSLFLIGVMAAQGFTVHSQDASVVRILPGVTWTSGEGFVFSFYQAHDFSSLSFSGSNVVFDDVGIGGYASSTVTANVTQWTQGPATVIQYTASAAGGTSAFLNITGTVQHVIVDNVDQSANLTLWDGGVTLPWSSWTISHDFYIVLQPGGGSPPTFNGEDAMTFLWHYVLILGTFTIIGLALVLAYKIRERKGGA